MPEKIILTIDNKGNITVEGEGYSGPACDTILRKLAEAFGQVTDVQQKPEYYGTQELYHRTRTS